MEWRRGRNRSAPVFARSRSVPRQVEHRALVIGTEQIGAQRRTGEDRAVDLDRHIVAGLLTDPLPSPPDLRPGFLIELNPVAGCVFGVVPFGGNHDNRLVAPEPPAPSRLDV